MWGPQCVEKTRVSFIRSPAARVPGTIHGAGSPGAHGPCWRVGGRCGQAACPREGPLTAGCKQEVCLLWDPKDGRKTDLSQVGDSSLKKTIQQVQMPCGLKDLGAQGPNLSEGSRKLNERNGVGS